MLAFRVIFTGAAIGTLILVAVHQRALHLAEVASLVEQPHKAPALESDRLDGLVKLREQMMQVVPQPQPAPEPPLQEVTLGSMPDTASGPSSAHAKAGDDLIGAGSVPFGHYDATQPAPTASDETGVAFNPAPATQDFQLSHIHI